MAMNFWEAQLNQRRLTVIYVTIFVMLTLGVAFLTEFTFRAYANESGFMDGMFPVVGTSFLAITFIAAAFNYLMYFSQGGGYVARQHGGRLVTRETKHFKEQMLLNIVEEMAIASSVPVPEVYVLDAQMINAFAAGIKQDNAAIAVTQGCLDKLTRDELQGVVAHEFGHIANEDMRLSLRLAAMIAGFFVVMYLGFRLLSGSARTRHYGGRGSKQGAAGLIFVSIILVIAGSVSWLAGSILKSTISRRREYLADASAVQFTRQSEGIRGALEKILKEQDYDMPKQGGAYSHLYFVNRGVLSRVFATHPPLEHRIQALKDEVY